MRYSSDNVIVSVILILAYICWTWAPPIFAHLFNASSILTSIAWIWAFLNTALALLLVALSFADKRGM